MWVELGIGRRAVEWLVVVSSEEPELLEPDHLLRSRMDAVLGLRTNDVCQGKLFVGQCALHEIGSLFLLI